MPCSRSAWKINSNHVMHASGNFYSVYFDIYRVSSQRKQNRIFYQSSSSVILLMTFALFSYNNSLLLVINLFARAWSGRPTGTRS